MSEFEDADMEDPDGTKFMRFMRFMLECVDLPEDNAHNILHTLSPTLEPAISYILARKPEGHKIIDIRTSAPPTDTAVLHWVNMAWVLVGAVWLDEDHA